jgi:hypothetical protein
MALVKRVTGRAGTAGSDPGVGMCSCQLGIRLTNAFRRRLS